MANRTITSQQRESLVALVRENRTAAYVQAYEMTGGSYVLRVMAQFSSFSGQYGAQALSQNLQIWRNIGTGYFNGGVDPASQFVAEYVLERPSNKIRTAHGR